jgi:hypothetical protein
LKNPSHRKDAKNAKIKASLAEFTEGAEDKILFACPENFSGQAKRLFWRMESHRFSRNYLFLWDLCVLAVK